MHEVFIKIEHCCLESLFVECSVNTEGNCHLNLVFRIRLNYLANAELVPISVEQEQKNEENSWLVQW